jgi:hypothetical protein
MTLDDHDAMMNLEQSGFFDRAIVSKPPTDLGEGYNITAHLNLDGKLVPFIQMVYYPRNEGQSSYVHYTARLEGESLKTVSEWNILGRNADSALRELMTANNIMVQPAVIKAPEVVAPEKEPVVAPAAEAEPVAAPSASPAPIQTPYVIAALVAGILALAGITLALRRRTVNQPTS